MFRSVFYLLLILLMPFRLWADETSEEIATINKRIEILSQELARYSKVKTYREIETELGQLEHQIATASVRIERRSKQSWHKLTKNMRTQ